ncbi:hypothetical protein BC834DRAFT_874812 [Gloeopeniophorella convolvens]|nr:hypothetical protein BC834DRAFT_874812 [Gloeopeniophorella convolvens]
MRILELLAPLLPLLQSVPLHIDVARAAIVEKITEGCNCANTRGVPPVSPSALPQPTPDENLRPALHISKKRRLTADAPLHHSSAEPAVPDCMDHSTPDEQWDAPQESSEETLMSVRTPTQSRKKRPRSTSQTPISRSSKQDDNSGRMTGVARHQAEAGPSSNFVEVFAGFSMAPSVVVSQAVGKTSDRNPFARLEMPPGSAPRKRFIQIDDDDDDNDEEL